MLRSRKPVACLETGAERPIRWAKYLYLSEGQLIAALIIIAKLTGDALPATSGVSAGTGASSSAGVRKNVETIERAFVVLLYFCSAKALGRGFGQVFSPMDQFLAPRRFLNLKKRPY